MSAIAFLAGLGAGYVNQTMKNKEQERLDAQSKREQGMYDMTKTKFDIDQANQASLRAAGQPVPITTTPGAAMPAEAENSSGIASDNPSVGGYQVGANKFAQQGAAAADQAAQNTPQATMARQIAAMQGTGDFAGAQKLRVDTTQAQAAEQQIADRNVKNEITSLNTPEAISDFMSRTPADKMGGAFKAQVQYSPDKKTFSFNRINPDGTLTPTGKTFDNTTDGIEEAKTTLAGFMTPDQRIQHNQWMQQLQLKKDMQPAEKALLEARTKFYAGYGDEKNARAIGIEEGILNPLGRGLAPGTGGRGSPVERMSEIDKTTLLNINKQRDMIQQATIKAQADGSFDPASPGAVALKTQLATLSMKESQIAAKYSGNAAQPDPLGMRKPAGNGGAPPTPGTAPAGAANMRPLSPSEQSLRTQLTGDIGADPKALMREIAASNSDLQKLSSDPAAKALLQDHISEMERQLANLTPAIVPQAAPSAPATTASSIASAGIVPVAAAPRVNAAPALATQGVQSERPAGPVTVEQQQAFFRNKQQQVATASEKIKSDPRIPALLAKRDDAIRRGKPVEANSYVEQINEIQKSYGL